MKQASQDTINYISRGIAHVCTRFKRRAAGSPSESACQDYFKQELKKWADQVDEEAFSVHPRAFLGWIKFAGFLNIVSVTLFWLRSGTDTVVIPLISFLSILLSACIHVFEFLLYRRFIDPFFPEAQSKNIIAIRKPKGETKRRILFGGHADASYEMTFAVYGPKYTIFVVMLGSTIGMFLILIFNTMVLFNTLMHGHTPLDGYWRILGIIEVVMIPFSIAFMFFINWGRIVDGANDNLSGCFVAMGVLKELSEQAVRFENTEVCCLITGAEESGLRGALAYAKRHQKELKETDTIFIALDTLREIEQLQVYTRGQNALQKNSKQVGALLIQAGKNCGVDLCIAKPYPGATDAEAFSRYGLKACGFCGVDHNPKPYYHTRYDTYDNISKDCIKKALNICMEAVKIYDQKGGLIIPNSD